MSTNGTGFHDSQDTESKMNGPHRGVLLRRLHRAGGSSYRAGGAMLLVGRLVDYLTNSISPGRQLLSKNGRSGL